ncbi:MAG: helix-turn-helix domain-containing protein [Parvularculaceae bacterium]
MRAPTQISRRERKKRETRLRILDAAIALMSERGYDKVKVEEIAARADVANATFFLHFPTKASLITAFNEQVADKIGERLSGFDLGAVEKLELLRAIVLDEWGRHGDLLRKIVADAAAQEAGAFVESNASLITLVSEIVAEGQAKGELSRDFDPLVVAQSLDAAWRAATLQWAMTGDARRVRRANRQALDLILRGAIPR